MMKRKDIEQMQAAGLISARQAVAIAEHFHLNANRGQQYVVRIMAALAGMLILGGIVMLISANWELIPDVVKMSVSMLLLLGFWIAWARTRVVYPWISEGLGLVGGGMWLGCIALYGQIFQLQNPFAEGCMLFFLGVCAIPFIVRQRMLVVLVAVASAVLLGALMDNRESWLSLQPWISDDSAVMACWVLLCLVWWLLGEHWRTSTGFCRSYAWIGIVAILHFLCIVQIPLLYQAIRIREDSVTVVMLLLLAVPLLLLWKPKDVAWPHWGLMITLLSLPYPIGLMLSGAAGGAFLGVLCGFAMGGGLMYLGYAARRISWLNYGSLMVFFAGIALIANVLESLTGSGMVLIMAGGLLLGLVWLLEKQRRTLAKSIKENA